MVILLKDEAFQSIRMTAKILQIFQKRTTRLIQATWDNQSRWLSMSIYNYGLRTRSTLKGDHNRFLANAKIDLSLKLNHQ